MNNTLESIRKYEHFEAIRITSKEKVRAMKEDENAVFVFAKGRSRYGYRYDNNSFLNEYTIVQKDEGNAWHKRLKTVVARLNASGLWTEIKVVFENLLKVDYSDWQDLKQNYFYDGEKMYEKYNNKYPFMFDEGHRVNTDYVFELSECKTKSMYFGKWRNTETKARIQKALAGKESITERAYDNYDLTFSYDAKLNKAWYSEEYKNCGNGHYYLAIDNSMAVFCEND